MFNRIIKKKNLLATLSVGVGIAALYLVHRKLVKKEKKLINHLIISANDHLTEAMAKQRKSIIDGNVEYELEVQLMKGENYSGKVTVKFKTHLSNTLFIDFQGKIIEASINGNKFIPKVFNNTFVEIPAILVKNKSDNKLVIEFSNSYRNDGVGLHSFIDTDSKQYLYTQGEPFHIHKMFPCFDQPNIKGSFKLTATAPIDWIVISNEIDISCEHNGNDYVWKFNKTQNISTYLYALVAGPFECLKCVNSYRNIPIKMYCRDSLFKYLENISETFFDVTNKCLEFYEGFFGVNYPFSKYDSVFCPEFNSSAMENPGCVIFSDSFHIPKGDVPLDKISRSCVTIAHEMAHMWFGNYVTMDWWDDLWLNESFADFIGFYALQNLIFKSKKSNFERLFNARKQWGYREDQQITTHPIASVVRDTEEADSIFDGITYSKGAAVLRQLLSLMGPENFSKSLKSYFSKYAWSNTKLSDFMGCLEANFNPKIPLSKWKKQWISKAGLNCISPIWDNDTKILSIVQIPVLIDFPTLRFHKMKVAFFDADANIISKEVEVLPQRVTIIKCSEIKIEPNAIMLNYKDETFAKVRFDEMSLDYFKENLYKIKDELTQTMLWRFVYDMVRDARIPSTLFIDIIITNIDCEKELEFSIINEALTNANMAINAWTPDIFREDLAMKLFDLTMKLLLNTPSSNTQQILVLKSNLISFSKASHHINMLYEWYKGTSAELKSYELKIKDCWALTRKIVKSKIYSKAQKEEILKEMLSRDQSDEGLLNAKEFQLLFATKDERNNAFDELLDADSKVSLYTHQAIMSGLNNSEYMTKDMANRYFNNVLELSKNRPLEYSKNFCEGMFPNFKDIDFLMSRTKEILAKADQSQTYAIRILKENLDMLERKNAAFKFFNLGKK